MIHAHRQECAARASDAPAPARWEIRYRPGTHPTEYLELESKAVAVIERYKESEHVRTGEQIRTDTLHRAEASARFGPTTNARAVISSTTSSFFASASDAIADSAASLSEGRPSSSSQMLLRLRRPWLNPAPWSTATSSQTPLRS